MSAALDPKHKRKTAGSSVVRMSEYQGVGHDSWDHAFAKPEFFTWLFAQKRVAAAAK